MEPKKPASAVYDESKISSLDSLEHIRQRPGMYIGRLNDGSHPEDGIYVLLKEVVDNSVDEYVMGVGKRVNIDIKDNTASIRDFGRGIPLGRLVECVSKINTGAKYNDEVFKFSVGLNGIGTKAVNALSENFTAIAYRDGKFKKAYFEQGILKKEEEGSTDERNGTFISFTPDRVRFPEARMEDNNISRDELLKRPINYTFNMDYVAKRIRRYSYLNSGLAFYLNGEKFQSSNGLLDLLNAETSGIQLYQTVHFKNDMVEFAMTHVEEYGETYYSFVNGQYTNDGGSHLSAFKEGLLRGINEFSGKSFTSQDLKDGMIGAIAIKLKDPIFESQTKNKLGNADIKGTLVPVVKDAIIDYMHKHIDESKLIIDKIIKNEELRKVVSEAQKQSREKQKRMSFKIPKLRDCKHHFDDEKKLFANDTMIFLTEGDSAAGSMISSRNVLTQAIFALKGKPMNCYKEKIEKVYANEELYYIMQALNIEKDLDGLRYNKVVLATDADVDGLHIRNLLLTFFLTFFEQLVSKGHVYILETPLFRVRNKKETIYCYNEAERDVAISKLKGTPEITRFKGLGEISPSEFGQFIGEDIRLQPVSIDQAKGIAEILGFFMGENSPKRWEYIQKNLI